MASHTVSGKNIQCARIIVLHTVGGTSCDSRSRVASYCVPLFWGIVKPSFNHVYLSTPAGLNNTQNVRRNFVLWILFSRKNYGRRAFASLDSGEERTSNVLVLRNAQSIFTRGGHGRTGVQNIRVVMQRGIID